MDSQKVNELIGLLAEQARIYDDILKISKDKTDIIIKGKVSELESIVNLEQSLVIRMGKLETKRENIVNGIAKELDIEPEVLSLSEMVKYMDSEQAEKLEDFRNSLTNTLDELKGTNELNSKLIENSLEYINFSINLISSVDTGENNYGKSGVVNDGKKKSYLDIKL